MKTLIIFILFILLVIGGLFGYYESVVIINENEAYYIKTKFRPYKEYKQGSYIFPEKLLFYDPNAFLIHKVSQEMRELVLYIAIDLPQIKLLDNENKYKIAYSIAVSYKFTKDYELSLIKNTSKEEGEKQFRVWLEAVDQDIVFEEIERILLDNEATIGIKDILNKANNILYTKIIEKYTAKKILIDTNNLNHYYKSAPDLKLYKEQYQALRKLQKDILDRQSKLLVENKEEEILSKRKYNKAEKEIDRLTLYGELFRKYPATLKLLYLERLQNRTNNNIEDYAKDALNPFLEQKDKAQEENKETEARKAIQEQERPNRVRDRERDRGSRERGNRGNGNNKENRKNKFPTQTKR